MATIAESRYKTRAKLHVLELEENAGRVFTDQERRKKTNDESLKKTLSHESDPFRREVEVVAKVR